MTRRHHHFNYKIYKYLLADSAKCHKLYNSNTSFVTAVTATYHKCTLNLRDFNLNVQIPTNITPILTFLS